NTSTPKENVRCSPGRNAPTPTTWRAISSPRSFRIEMTTEYSHASPAPGWRTDPSTRSAEKLGDARDAAPGSKRRYFLHAGQTLALSRMTARQWGQRRVVPTGD